MPVVCLFRFPCPPGGARVTSPVKNAEKKRAMLRAGPSLPEKRP